jgi:phosphomannomutase
MIEDIARKNGCSVIRTAVGEINVSSELLRRGAVFGGEGNGGVMLPEIHPCRDAVVGMELILQSLLESGRPFHELVDRLPKYFIRKVKVDIRGINLKAALERFRRLFPGGRADTQDGIRIDLDRERAWVQVRKSNTEPIVRVIAEAPSNKKVDELIKKATASLK